MAVNRTRRGFSLVEALVASTLLGVGIFASLKCMGGITQAQERAMASEDMQRLALRKYDEIVALGILTSGHAAGDFTDIGESRYVWQADRQPMNIGNLDSISVDVVRRGGDFSHATRIVGLLCRPSSSNGGSQ